MGETKTSGTSKGSVSISINAGYESDKADMPAEEKAARDFLKAAHKTLIGIGRVCYIGAIGVSLFSFLAGGALPPEAQTILSGISSIGWDAWWVNISARTIVFYFLGEPLTNAATWVVKRLSKHNGKSVKIAKQEELRAAIEWKAAEFSTDYVKEAELMTELDIQRENIKDNIISNPRYAKRLVREYRQKAF